MVENEQKLCEEGFFCFVFWRVRLRESRVSGGEGGAERGREHFKQASQPGQNPTRGLIS